MNNCSNYDCYGLHLIYSKFWIQDGESFTFLFVISYRIEQYKVIKWRPITYTILFFFFKWCLEGRDDEYIIFFGLIMIGFELIEGDWRRACTQEPLKKIDFNPYLSPPFSLWYSVWVKLVSTLMAGYKSLYRLLSDSIFYCFLLLLVLLLLLLLYYYYY